MSRYTQKRKKQRRNRTAKKLCLTNMTSVLRVRGEFLVMRFSRFAKTKYMKDLFV